MYQTVVGYSSVAGVSGTGDMYRSGQRAQQGCLVLCLFEGGEEMFSAVLTSVVRMLWLRAPQLTSALLLKASAVRCLQNGRKEGCLLRTPCSGKQGEGTGNPTPPCPEEVTVPLPGSRYLGLLLCIPKCALDG